MSLGVQLKRESLGLLGLALALSGSMLLVLCLQAATVNGLTQGDEEFFDAEPDAFERRMDMDEENENEDEDEETFYDAEDEINYDEDAEENVCASSDSHSCPTCCRRLGFDLPHWNKAIGQCLCYLSEADQNVCKATVSGSSSSSSSSSAQTCKMCCRDNHYELSFFSDRSQTCYCSLPDEQFYRWAPRRRVQS